MPQQRAEATGLDKTIPHFDEATSEAGPSQVDGEVGRIYR